MSATALDRLTLSDALSMMPADERLALLLPLVHQDVKDKTYQQLPLGREVADFLRIKRKRLTPASERAYEAALAAMVLYFPTLELRDLELPAGVGLLERFMDETWGGASPRTYNKNRSFVSQFFKFQVIRGRMHGNPCDPIEPAKPRQVHRTIFTPDQRHAILASAASLRDRIALRLLFDYGLRQGSLRAVQFKHFDHQRKRLTIFGKGGKVRELPVPQSAFWMDLERLILDLSAEPHHFLMPTATGNQHARRVDPTRPMSNRAAHYWWYARLADAGIVAPGASSGERMHKARHCLALDTPILTVNRGWSVMGDLAVGDWVYAEDGTQTRVIGRSDVQSRDCYELEFGDGSRITATDDHRWPVWDACVHAGPQRGAWRVLTTEEVARTCHDSRGHNRYRVRCDAVLKPDAFALPIDPYIFGYWLGDGYSHHAEIVVGTQDRDHLTGAMRDRGYSVLSETPRRSEWGEGWRIRFANGEPRGGGIESKLRALGVLGSGRKRIPPCYLQASVDQRRDLLAGILDSDGSSTASIVQFRSTLPAFAGDVFELTRSLGLRSRLRVVRVPKGKPQWNVTWTPPEDPFSNPRKSAKFIPVDRAGKRAKRIDRMSITNVRRVPTVPTCCIEIAHQSHVFLVGRTFVPTCNTAGQRVLDATGNLKAVQEFLGHSSIATTGDVYVGWADERLAADIARTLGEDS